MITPTFQFRPFFWLAFCAAFTSFAEGQGLSRSDEDFFENKIRPVLATHCYECHSLESGKAKGGLKVDSRDSLRSGGDTGPAIVAGSAEKSLLYQSITYDGDYQMPPKGKLPDDVIADFRKWISMGAPDPRVVKIVPDVPVEIDLESGRNFWAYQKPVMPSPPAVQKTSWPRSDIDRFVQSELEQKQLQPVRDADAQTLVRRLYFVITGLPSDPKDAEAWMQKITGTETGKLNQNAIAELVDQLLASPQYGERWGRHWMDVARFAESTGGDQNNIYQHAWRYRDYVIDSFNADVPFDQFVREQIAGDLLPIADDQEWARNVIATGFLAVGVKNVGEVDQQKFFADLIDEQIDTTTRAFLGTSVACARCHDHKSDPIPQIDYYAMAGIFRATSTHYGLIKAQARQATTLLDLTGLGPEAGSPSLSQKEFAALVQARDDARQALDDAMKKIRSGENVFRGLLRKYRSDRDETEAALLSYGENGQPRVFAMGIQDRDLPLETRLLVRGEIDKPAQIVPRGVLQVVSTSRKNSFSPRLQGSGRLELADWIADRENPLTARVMANRVWHWMFGQGLVRTVDDFGRTGEAPSHPELLDFIASRLVENNWSVKALIREIALSRTWQLSSDFDEANFAVDPDNRLLWRMNKRRLEGEAIRDSMLAVSGKLDLKLPLGTLLREVGEGNVGQNVFEPVIRELDSPNRSVYLPRVRNVLPECLELFDSPDASVVTGMRDTSSSPLQSLYLMNGKFVTVQATAMAQRLMAKPSAERLDYAYMLSFGRHPSPTEREQASHFMRQLNEASRFDETEKLAVYCQALFSTAEFVSLD